MRLEVAALRLLERNGVLAGLNLREVADEAEVTRGLVYHHFGSRRALLRSALARSVQRRRSNVVRRRRLPAGHRLAELFSASMADARGIRLLALLVLDGDDGFTALPYSQYSREANERDISLGLLAADVDPDAMQAGLLAAIYGWVVFRKAFAASLARDPAELDADVLTMLSRMWAPGSSPAPQPGSGVDSPDGAATERD